MKHHPLVKGNKRLGWLATAVFLELNGVEMTGIDNDEAVEFVMVVTVGADDIEQIADLLRRLATSGPDES